MPDSPVDLRIPVHLGQWFAGATGLALAIVFPRTGGGYLRCVEPVSGTTAYCTGFVRRYDPRRQTPLGAVVQQGPLTEVDPAHGRYLWDWLATDLGAVPRDPGIYVLQIFLVMPSGQETYSQRGTFEVLASSPIPV